MSPRAWARDLALGARFAVTGGRRGWIRTALTAVGVGLGVGLLLLASSVPNLLEAREVRDVGRAPDLSESVKPSAESFLYLRLTTLYRGETVNGLAVRADGADAPVPPGAAKLPGPGEMLVSPALAELLGSSRGALLKDRFPYRTVGTIGDAGLVGPDELWYYAGSATLTVDDADGRARNFGWQKPIEPLGGFLLLLVAIACVVLLLPVLVFVATAVRFGGEQRDRRLAALRLVGADTAMTRRIAAGESLASALLGLALGAGLFALSRQLVGLVTVWNINAFPVDVVPATALALLVVVAVPVSAVAVTVLALRGVAIEPLGVVRNAAPRPRRVWWRLLMVAAGVVMLLPMADGIDRGDTSINTLGIAAGAVLALTGLTTLLPWLVEACVKRLRGGPLPWQLAVRRLQLSSGTAARAVSGIVVAAAGAIALQMLVQAIEDDFMTPTRMDSARAQLSTRMPAEHSGDGARMIEAFATTKGVTGVIGTVSSHVWRPGPLKAGEDFAPLTSIVVAECASLAELAKLPACADGDVFIARTHGREGPENDYLAETARAGAEVSLRDVETTPTGEQVTWRIPARARTVDSRRDPMGYFQFGIFATPSAFDASKLREAEARAMVRLDPSVPDAAEHARNTAARIDALARVDILQDVERDSRYASVRTGILVGATATMILVAASLLVTTLEQLRDRRRLLSSLVAFGTRRTTLSWSVLWQTAIPIVLGLLLAAAGGLGLGLVLLAMVDKTVTDWWVFLPVTGVGAALIATVTLLSLPPLWRMMRPDGLRTE